MNMKQYLYRLWQWVYKGIPVMKVNAGIATIDAAQRLKGRKILVTGSSKGIGLQIAERYVQEGAAVVIVGRNEDALIQEAN